MPDRVIRDELLTSERYWAVSQEAQLLYLHLLLNVDDAARFSGKNFTLRAACFPGRAVTPDRLEGMLAELHDNDLVRVYHVGTERFLFVPRFKNRRRYVGRSKYPAPPIGINDLPDEKSDSSHPQVRPKTDSSPTQVRRRGVGEERGKSFGTTSTTNRGSRLPAGWQLGEAETSAARAIRPAWTDAQVRAVWEKFRDYWSGVSGAKGVKLDWLATWRNWVRNETTAPVIASLPAAAPARQRSDEI